MGTSPEEVRASTQPHQLRVGLGTRLLLSLHMAVVGLGTGILSVQISFLEERLPSLLSPCGLL